MVKYCIFDFNISWIPIGYQFTQKPPEINQESHLFHPEMYCSCVVKYENEHSSENSGVNLQNGMICNLKVGIKGIERFGN